MIRMDSNIISVKLFPEICRVCLKKAKSPHTLFLINGTKTENQLLEKLLAKFCEIEVKKDDELPQHVCANCIFSLAQMDQLYQMCKESQKTLNNVLMIERNTLEKNTISNTAEHDINNYEIPFKRSENNMHNSTGKYLSNDNPRFRNNGGQIIKLKEHKIEIHEQNPESSSKHNPIGQSLGRVQCNINFSSTKHSDTHQNSNAFKCNISGKEFEEDCGIYSYESSTLKRDRLGRLIQCGICKTVCSSYHTYRLHKAKEHTEGRKPHICPNCGIDFLMPSRLEKHLSAHTEERPFLCTMCPKRFKIKVHLTTHIKTLHTEEPPREVKCTKCDEFFESVKKMRSHRDKHYIKPFLCSICGIYLTKRINWVLHMRSHTGERPYKCEYCDKTFAKKFQYNAHQNTHTGQTPYVCKSCNKAFTTPKRLRTHRKSHITELHKCNYCDMAFLQNHNLKRHTKIHEMNNEAKSGDLLELYEDNTSYN